MHIVTSVPSTSLCLHGQDTGKNCLKEFSHDVFYQNANMFFPYYFLTLEPTLDPVI